jgi:non-ribosomal peptide synthetase component F
MIKMCLHFYLRPVFDASTFEIWTPLLNGNSLVIPEDLRTLLLKVESSFIDSVQLSLNNISVLWLTKITHLRVFILLNDRSIIMILISPREYPYRRRELWIQLIINDFTRSIGTTPRNFLNGYGPTESTTFTCIYALSS